MPWKAIAELAGCESVLPGGDFSRCFVIRTQVDETGWMIGPYEEMTRFATKLRHDADLRDLLGSQRIRIGLRKTDVPPAGTPRQVRYGPAVPGDDCHRDFTDERLDPLVLPVGKEAVSTNRKTDREQNVKTFWETQTPQSHHVVEFNSLSALGVSTADGKTGMDYRDLPAVLLAAEFHQRYISAILKPAHRWGKIQLHSEMAGLYRDLYRERSKLFEPLWLISKAILERAGVPSD
jgi:hypothetical protein